MQNGQKDEENKMAANRVLARRNRLRVRFRAEAGAQSFDQTPKGPCGQHLCGKYRLRMKLSTGSLGNLQQVLEDLQVRLVLRSDPDVIETGLPVSCAQNSR